MLFDTHCHLANDELVAEASELATRARSRNVRGFAVIAADPESLARTPATVAKIRAACPDAHCIGTSGLHPHEAQIITPDMWKQVETQASDAAAIGETGLDFHYHHSGRDVQIEMFERHIALACRLKKPLVIHCREAATEVLAALETPAVKAHPNPGILHCFTEDAPTAKRLLDLNFYISFSGILTFKNAEPLREVARQVPLERALIETDSPWLAPIPNRGKRNEPSFVADTFEAFVQLRREPREEVEAALWANSCRVFGLAVAS